MKSPVDERGFFITVTNVNTGVIGEFVGSYDLHLIRTEQGWRIDSFKYNVNALYIEYIKIQK